MRLINQNDRLKLVVDGLAVDVEKASDHRFAADPQAIYERWNDFRAWVASTRLEGGEPIIDSELGPPVPRPSQIFAVGVNYRDHVEEAGFEEPTAPFVFTKFPASVTGPYSTIELPTATVDWEVEVVAVVGQRARHVQERDGWDYVAGLTVGQDLSERELQLSGPAPQQFNLGKSFAGFTPIGPALVTPDELNDPDDIAVQTVVSGDQMQSSRTRNLIFPIPRLISYLSHILPLLPGDLVFTGTPSGIGWALNPQRFITPVDELITWAEGIGEMRHGFVAAPTTLGETG